MDIRLYIREHLRAIVLEDYRYQYDGNKHYPPSDVIGTAKRALEIVQRYKKVQADGSNEGSGLQKAHTLADGEPLDHAQLKRMDSFFTNNFEKVKQARIAGEDIKNSEILQKWELWGGDAGMKWAKEKIGSTHSTNDTSKKLRPSGHKRMMDPTNTRVRDNSTIFKWKG